jgi:hypothetical protein
LALIARSTREPVEELWVSDVLDFVLMPCSYVERDFDLLRGRWPTAETQFQWFRESKQVTENALKAVDVVASDRRELSDALGFLEDEPPGSARR